jgi:hypothetical protein
LKRIIRKTKKQHSDEEDDEDDEEEIEKRKLSDEEFEMDYCDEPKFEQMEYQEEEEEEEVLVEEEPLQNNLIVFKIEQEPQTNNQFSIAFA